MDAIARINQLREERAWTVYRLSERAGIAQSTLINMATRGTSPSIATLTQICSAFGITLAQFFTESEEQQTLTKDEIQLVENYRELTYKNREIVGTIIDKLKEED